MKRILAIPFLVFVFFLSFHIQAFAWEDYPTKAPFDDFVIALTEDVESPQEQLEMLAAAIERTYNKDMILEKYRCLSNDFSHSLSTVGKVGCLKGLLHNPMYGTFLESSSMLSVVRDLCFMNSSPLICIQSSIPFFNQMQQIMIADCLRTKEIGFVRKCLRGLDLMRATRPPVFPDVPRDPP